MIQSQKRERRDWTLLIFIIPLGIFLIIIVGQIAIRLSPNWSVNADMNSNLEPDPNAAPPLALLQPILPQILTPMAWMESYLTPGADIYFPPFMTFEPTATPSQTEVTSTQVSNTPAPTATETPSPTSTSVTGTALPTDTPEGTEPPGGGGGSSTPPPTTPPPTTPPPTTPPPTTPPPTGYPSTIDPGLTAAAPPPEINVGMPDNDPLINPPDNGIGNILEGTYIVISLRVKVGGTPNANYDLAYYEYNSDNGGAVFLDWIIIGITKDPTGASYYEIFNWGNNTPDSNSNVDYTNLPADPNCPSDGECDNREIPVSGNTEAPPSENILYDPDYDPGNPPTTPETNGPAPQTGILIDVDTADSQPPPDTYDYLVIINPSGGGDAAQVDAIQTVEVPIPTP